MQGLKGQGKVVDKNLEADSRLDGSWLQTVGDKNYDGFLIAISNEQWDKVRE